MRKFTIALLALIAVLAITLVVLPNLISWNLFKPEIEAAVRKATGRGFEIGGDIDVSLFPGVRFRLGDIRLGNAPAMSAQNMVTLRNLGGKLEVWPLLFGRLADLFRRGSHDPQRITHLVINQREEGILVSVVAFEFLIGIFQFCCPSGNDLF